MDSIVEIWEQLAVKYGSRTALKDETTGYSLSFCELNEKINKVSQILENLNIEEGSNLLLCLNPHPLWHVIDQAIMKSNFVSVSCDSNSSYSEIKYFVNKMNIKVLFTDNISLINNIVQDKILIHTFYVDKSILSKNEKNKKFYTYDIIEEINKVILKTDSSKKCIKDRTATMFFSSGTSNNVPKCVMYSHKQILLAFYDYFDNINDFIQGTSVSILSLSHVAPRLNEWALLLKGNTIIYTNYNKYMKSLKKYKPQYLLCVPKLLDDIIEKYNEEISNTSKIFQVFNTIALYMSNVYYDIKFKYSKNIAMKLLLTPISIFISVFNNFFSRKVINKFLNPDCSIITFGAFVNKNTEKLFASMGINLMIQYGLTETCACISYTSNKNKKIYSVGKINPNMDVIIADLKTNKKLGCNEKGMIKVKGKQVMKGYYNNEEETKKVFDYDGYLITGDLGYIDEENFLYFIGRDKSVIVLNNGENVDSVKIEEICNKSKFIKQIVVFGQDKPYLTALAVLEQDYVFKWIENKNIDINKQTGKDLLKKDILIDINNLIGENRFFRWTEQIKDICFINEPFTIENGFMTRKYTIIRNKIYDRYKNLIDNMYE